jgi:hypothetical protein
MNPIRPPMPGQEAAVPAGPGFGRLLTRYLLPVGLCAEPRGDLFLAHAMRVQNLQALKRWMPHYARVHAALASGLLGLCSGANAAEVSAWLVAATAVPAAAELVLAIVFSCVSLVLRLGQD